MKRLHRVVACLLPCAAALCACNAILGIGELTPPEQLDAAVAPADGNSDANDAAAPATPDASSESGAPGIPACAEQPNADPCLVVIDQTAETIYPTWRLTSYNYRPTIGGAVIQPVLPVYQDAGDGTVIETHSQLTWQTRLAADASTFAFADAENACAAAFGADWRLPSRVELESLHARDLTKMRNGYDPYDNCMPTAFEPAPAPKRTWSSTEQLDGGKRYFGYEGYTCGLDPYVTAADKLLVRCVKGDRKPATFVVRKSADLVWARETNLDWERNGIIVKTYEEAKAHCDARSARVPIVEEVTSIIDSRVASIFDPTLFVAPDGGVRAIVTATQIFRDADGGLLSYEALATVPEILGAVDAFSAVEPEKTPDLLVRCVREHID